MTQVGASDFLQTVGQPGVPILVQPVTNLFIGTPQSFDLTSLIQPNYQTFTIFWVAALASAGAPISVLISSSFNSVTFLGPTRIGDGNFTVGAVPGAYLAADPSVTFTLTASAPTGGASPIGGTLIVFASTAPPAQIGVVRGDLIGFGQVANVSVPGTGAATILAAPPTDRYYRIKTVWAEAPNPGVSAGASLAVQRLSDLAPFLGFRADGTATQNLNFPMDVAWFDGLRGANNAASAWSMGVVYEVWAL